MDKLDKEVAVYTYYYTAQIHAKERERKQQQKTGILEKNKLKN